MGDEQDCLKNSHEKAALFCVYLLDKHMIKGTITCTPLHFNFLLSDIPKTLLGNLHRSMTVLNDSIQKLRNIIKKSLFLEFRS